MSFLMFLSQAITPLLVFYILVFAGISGCLFPDAAKVAELAAPAGQPGVLRLGHPQCTVDGVRAGDADGRQLRGRRCPGRPAAARRAGAGTDGAVRDAALF